MKTPFIKTENQALGRPDIDTFKSIDKRLIVVLDEVRSAHNVGSIFRSSDAFLVEEVFLCGITPTPPSKEIRKTALGAEQSVAWSKWSSTLEAIEELKRRDYEIWAIEQASSATDLRDFTPMSSKKYALVFGNEVFGVDQEVINQCDGVIEIAQGGTKHSLNVSVSAGVVLWHCFRQNQKTP
jgi:23S rRNA (guanosine2251-2'-O)-methyltransferase